MPDMPIFAFILLGILLCAFAGIALFFFLLDHRDQYYRYEEDVLITGKSLCCEFQRIGGSEDEHTSLKLTFDGGDSAALDYQHCPRPGAKTKKKHKTVSADAVEKIRDVYRKHCIPVLADCMPREEIALDAPTVTVTFSSGETTYSINSDMEFPEKNKSVLHDVEELLMSYLS